MKRLLIIPLLFLTLFAFAQSTKITRFLHVKTDTIGGNKTGYMHVKDTIVFRVSGDTLYRIKIDDGYLYVNDDSLSLSGTGTVTSVATGYGLTGGPITGTGTITVDTSKVATPYDLTQIGGGDTTKIPFYYSNDTIKSRLVKPVKIYDKLDFAGQEGTLIWNESSWVGDPRDEHSIASAPGSGIFAFSNKVHSAGAFKQAAFSTFEGLQATIELSHTGGSGQIYTFDTSGIIPSVARRTLLGDANHRFDAHIRNLFLSGSTGTGDTVLISSGNEVKKMHKSNLTLAQSQITGLTDTNAVHLDTLQSHNDRIGGLEARKYKHEGITAAIIGNSTSAYDAVKFNATAHYMDCYTYDLAVGGSTIQAGGQRLDTLNHTAKQNLDYVFVLIGINNCWRQEDTSAQITAYQNLITKINDSCPNAKVIINTMTPCLSKFNVRWNSTDGDTSQTCWLAINRAIRGQGADAITGADRIFTKHTELFDDGAGNLKTIYDYGDSIHPNNLGRQIIASMWNAYIDSVQASTSIVWGDKIFKDKVFIDTVNVSDTLVEHNERLKALESSGGGSQWTTTGSNIYYNTGNVGIGTSTPTTKLDVYNGDIKTNKAVNADSSAGTWARLAGTVGQLNLSRDGAGSTATFTSYGSYPVFAFRRYSGSYGTKTAVLADEEMGEINWKGYNGSAVNTGGAIGFYAGGNWSGSSYPTYITFKTVTSGTTTNSEKVRITDAGKVGIGTTAPDSTFHVVGDGHFSDNLRVEGKLTASTLKVTGLSTDSSPDSALTLVNGEVKRAAWPSGGSGTATDVQVFTATGSNTWTKPSGAIWVEVICIGGGGGGGSGRRGADGSVRCGGGGGGGGGYSKVTLNASLLGSTETAYVGTGGTGGTAKTTNDASGAAGNNGNASYFGSYIQATGGNGGSGGTNANGFGGSYGTGLISNSANGGAANTSGGAGASGGVGNYAPSSGAAGGGISSADAVANGGTGGAKATFYYTTTAGGTSGTSGASGGNGNTMTGIYCGTGGGGGASSRTTNAGSGGNGASYGAGGGGGGASLNDIGNSGAGGNGADGIVIVITYF